MTKNANELVAALHTALMEVSGMRWETAPLPRIADENAKLWRVVIEVPNREQADEVYRALWAVADHTPPTREEEMREAIEAMPTATPERMEALKHEKALRDAWPIHTPAPIVPHNPTAEEKVALHESLMRAIQRRAGGGYVSTLVVGVVLDELYKLKGEQA